MNKFIVVAGNNQALVKKALLKRGNWEDVTEEKNDGDYDNVQFVWKPTNFSIRAYAKMDSNPNSFESMQIFNHFENINGICTKTGLIRSLRTYYYSTEQALKHRYTIFESTPTTFLITSADENQEYINFIARFKDIAKRQFNKEHVPEKHCQENLWLIKPANLNQGRGIEIFNNLKDIQSFLSIQKPNTYWVAQKYLEKPLLYYGRKFDIRVWVLITAKLEIFFYKTPYMRTSSDIYVTNAFDNYIHLTNNCLQKHGENFGKFEAGNTLPLSALQDYINQFFPQHGLDVEKQIIPRMKDLIIDTILSVKKTINPKRRKNCFELFGYDFIIDEDFRTWLLEVNTNPYLGVPNDFIKNLLPEMMDDLLRITLDPYYPPSSPELKSINKENAFELIFCEYHSTYHEGPLNVRSQFSENIYPVASLAPPLRHLRLNQAQDKENKNAKDVQDTKDLTSSNLSLKNNSDKETLETHNREIIKQESFLLGRKKNTVPKVATIPIIDQNEVQANSSPLSGREKRLSVPKVTGQEKGYNNNNIAETAKKIDSLLESYLLLDNEMLMPLILRLLSSLTNWELQSDKEISSACKAITMLSESRMCGVLTEPNIITQMINLLDSQDVPLKIQITLIKGFLNICKKISETKKIICDKMVHALIRISLASCDPAQIQNYDHQVIKLAVKCLGTISGKYDRKMYIPGETRDHDKVRNFLINQGGLLALMIVSKVSLDEEIKELPIKTHFCYLNICDWELQKSILENQKDEKIQLVAKEIITEETDSSPNFGTNGSNTYMKSKTGLGFVSGSFSNGSKLENKKFIDLNQEILPNIPKYLLERNDYSVNDMIKDIEERINSLKEEKKKQEQEEEEKKEQVLQEQMKEQQQKEIMMLERKKKADEIFMKRLEERKKQQEELAKKIEEENKLKKQQEEEQKRLKLQELAKKREEYEKKARKFEVKKKKLEEEMKKIVEEEIEKKKAQRKALEESFWLRVRAREKEKVQEKEMPQIEGLKRKDDITHISIERTLSVEPNRSRDETTEKSKLLRTHTFGSPQHSGQETRSNTFSNFFKEDPISKVSNSPLGQSQSYEGIKGIRQRSVEEGRSRKKHKENMVLPYIDIHNGGKLKGRGSFEKPGKSLKQSDLFTLNEAEEEAIVFYDENQTSSPLMKQLLKQPNTVRLEEGEKLKKMTASSEQIRTSSKKKNMNITDAPVDNLIYLKEIVADRIKEKEKEKIKEIVIKHKEASLGGLRHISPQSLNEFAHTNMYKAYIGVKRKLKIQQTLIKH